MASPRRCTSFEVGEYQYVGVTCDVAAGSLLLSYRGNEGGIGLQLTVDLQFGSHLLSQLCSLNNLVDHLVGGATLRGEAQHCHAWVFEASH